jgi:hypothetical protein
MEAATKATLKDFLGETRITQNDRHQMTQPPAGANVYPAACTLPTAHCGRVQLANVYLAIAGVPDEHRSSLQCWHHDGRDALISAFWLQQSCKPCLQMNPRRPYPRNEPILAQNMPSEHESRALGLLVSAAVNVSHASRAPSCSTNPSSKCLHRLIGSCDFCLHTLHSSRSTIFLVVFAFLWNTGLVWPLHRISTALTWSGCADGRR